MISFTVSFLFTKLADLRLCKIPLLFFYFLFLLLSFCLFSTFFLFLSNDQCHGRFIWLVQAPTICIIYLDRIQDYQMIVFLVRVWIFWYYRYVTNCIQYSTVSVLDITKHTLYYRWYLEHKEKKTSLHRYQFYLANLSLHQGIT